MAQTKGRVDPRANAARPRRRHRMMPLAASGTASTASVARQPPFPRCTIRRVCPCEPIARPAILSLAPFRSACNGGRRADILWRVNRFGPATGRPARRFAGKHGRRFARFKSRGRMILAPLTKDGKRCGAETEEHCVRRRRDESLATRLPRRRRFGAPSCTTVHNPDGQRAGWGLAGNP